MFRRLRLAAERPILLGLAALLIACSGPAAAPISPTAAAPASPGPTPASSAALTLYNGQHAATTNALVAAFTQQTGISVEVRSGQGSGLTNQIIEEGSGSPADLVFTENWPELMVLDDKGLLAGVDAQTLAAVPAQYNSPTGHWVGVDARATVLVYNPAQVSPDQLPASILNLADPVWKGRIGIAPSENDFQPVVTAVVDLHGQAKATEWLKGLKDNATGTFNGNTAILNAVKNGQIAAGVINNYYWFRQAAEAGPDNMKSSLYYFGHGDPGALVNVSPAGALASSKHPQEAQAFLRFLVSSAGQQVIATSNDFEYPLGSGVQADPRLKPFASLEAPSVTIAQLGDDSQAIALLQQVGLL